LFSWCEKADTSFVRTHTPVCKNKNAHSCKEKPSEVLAVKENMLFILDIIISLTQVASRGRGEIVKF